MYSFTVVAQGSEVEKPAGNLGILIQGVNTVKSILTIEPVVHPHLHYWMKARSNFMSNWT